MRAATAHRPDEFAIMTQLSPSATATDTTPSTDVAAETMSTEQTTVELTARQQELLLKGLKFVRSNVALDMQIPSEEIDAGRKEQYEELDNLETMLSAPRTPRQPR